MSLTQRDFEILKYIGRCSFVTADLIMEYFDMSKSPCYRRINELKRNGLVAYKKKAFNQKALISITREGAKVLELPFSRPGTVVHNLVTVKCLNVFVKKHYQGCNFITERELKKDYRFGEKRGHIPDFIIVKENVKIPFEIELTRKSQQRIDEIFHFYCSEKEYQDSKIMYVCTESPYRKLKKEFNDCDNFKVIHIKNIIPVEYIKELKSKYQALAV